MTEMNDNDIMPFGIHEGKKIANVPAGYLQWFKDNVIVAKHTESIHNYIKENWDSIKKELAG